jgi:hypothetical protein
MTSIVKVFGLGATSTWGNVRLESAKRCKANEDQATFTNLDFWANGLSRPDGGEELAHLGLEALVFVGEQLR